MPELPKYTLAIETATRKGSLSLLKGREEVGFWIGDDSQALSSALLPQISTLLAANNLTTSDLELIAVSAGPGSFTGIRIGLSVAKALRAALDVPAIAVTLHEALALSADEWSGSVVTLIPSGRTEVYWQEFYRDSRDMKPLLGPASVKVEDPPRPSGSGYIFFGTSDMKPEYVRAIEGRFGGTMQTAPDGLARYVGEAAIARYLKGESGHSLSPVYVKGFHA